MKSLLMTDDVYLDKTVDGIESIRTNLQARLSIVRGEYVPNVYLGFPLGANRAELDLCVQGIISGTYGIVKVTEFSSRMLDGVYRCSFTAETIYGVLRYE